MTDRWSDLGRPAAALFLLLVGLAAQWLGHDVTNAQRVWYFGLILLGAPVVIGTLRGMLRGQFAADVVASLSIVGAGVLAQPLAGLIIVLMQTGGEALEHFAARRASRAVAELEAQAPRIAHRRRSDRSTEDVPVDQVVVGDLLIVRPGEMVPTDGEVIDHVSVVDTSRITGEPLPRTVEVGAQVSSGMLVQETALHMRSTALASRSLYHQVVELVRSAESSKAPLQRMADRAAVWFTPVTLVLCVVAYLISHDPQRVLAVLVVATPCPLILAAPVAMLGGINRSAKHQIIVRHGGALEALASVSTVVFDKTGTLTLGQPVVARLVALEPFSQAQVLLWAGAVEQAAGHLLARSVVSHAQSELGELPTPAATREAPGRGITGLVDGKQITVGSLSLLRETEPLAAATFSQAAESVGLRAFVVVDGAPAGWIEFSDQVRASAVPMIAGLRRLGIGDVVMLSGDHAANVAAVGESLGISRVQSDLLPQDKVHVVKELSTQQSVLMVGDGANDAPALATARVGMALAAHGGGISAQAADIVLLVDDLTRIAESIAIARHTMYIARQSVGVGLGLSLVGMGVAAAGYLPPIVGAVVQEAIDVAVILNALRVLRPGHWERSLHSLTS